MARDATISEWQDYTPALTGLVNVGTGVNAKQNGRWRRIGDSIDLMITIVVDDPNTDTGAGFWAFGLPPGLTSAVTRIGGTSFMIDDQGVDVTHIGSCFVEVGNTTIRGFLRKTVGTVLIAATAPFVWTGSGTDGVGDELYMVMYKIQIQEFN